MFGTIRSRIFLINIIFLVGTFVIIAASSMFFINYNLGRNFKESSEYYYEFENFSSIEETVKYGLYKPQNLYTKQALLNNFIGDSILSVFIFMLFIFIGLLIFILLIYKKIYDKYVLPFLDVESSRAKEFIEINKNIKRKETQIYNQKEDLYKINKYITHEFKNSLMALKGKLYIDKEDGIKYIDEISKQIEDLNALTTNKVDVVDIDFLMICAEVIEDFSGNIIFLFEDEDFTVRGNTTLIYRVLYNIIQNAFKYGANRVIVRVKKVDNNVVCEIENNGPKMDEKKIDNIFKMNYRINKLNKNGSGIGLSLVKNVMDILDGSVFVKSDYTNTIFYLSFVASNPKEAKKED